MSNITLLIDSNVLIALANQDDALHERAKALMDTISTDGQQFIISDYIFDEVVTVLAAKNRQVAIHFGNHLLQSKIVMVRVEPLFKQAWMIFCQEKDLSFTDATIVACMRIFGIEYLATFDKDFDDIKGIKVI